MHSHKLLGIKQRWFIEQRMDQASINSMSNRGTAGRSVGGSHNCRNEVCNENKIVESLPHIRGFCPKTELLLNAAHHRVRSAITDLFRSKNFEVYMRKFTAKQQMTVSPKTVALIL
ncbi:unnamed protein product [Macrosiphum euphorbiae]|uniref:Uncharacterized protein n=1 Tax=Macrosiphum euphorbiae TaxID=13131 RepID=A0AAV0WWQ7_9HEMI|nr:unnamed protein product [Macrosiphum euphorbiae]